ncbi:MAG: lipid-A-disaccharide synthase [Magnetococcales bacterium]|nr:lipid-A-disaccharide synthase [Magnetococcales bacterium]
MAERLSSNIVMVAGEASGDLLGGDLLGQLKTRFPTLNVWGVGGPRMQEQGLSGPYDVNDLSVIGLVEVIRRLPGLIRVFRYLTNLLKEKKPQLLITIDLPDFNFLLAARAKALGIPIVHYVSPQVWAWRSGRVNKIADLVDHLMVLFPFEAAIYSHTALPVSFVGHPLVEQLKPWMETRNNPEKKRELRRDLGILDHEKVVVLLPGSRHSEVKRLLAIMLATYEKVTKKGNCVRYVIAQADTLSGQEFESLWPTGLNSALTEESQKNILIRQGETHSLLAIADAALVASGTATLETALVGTPMVVIYRVNPLTYEIGKRVIRVPFIALANLVAERKLVHERIQEEANPEQLADDLDNLLNNVHEVEEMQAGYQTIRNKLSQPLRLPVEIVADMLTNAAQTTSGV